MIFQIIIPNYQQFVLFIYLAIKPPYIISSPLLISLSDYTS